MQIKHMHMVHNNNISVEICFVLSNAFLKICGQHVRNTDIIVD